jgi:hypothetical protein
VPKQVGYFGSLSTFCLGCKTITRRAARRLIILHPKQESELKWQPVGFSGAQSRCLSVKRLKMLHLRNTFLLSN